jgi:hypothetical protein
VPRSGSRTTSCTVSSKAGSTSASCTRRKSRPGLAVERLLEEQLVLVSTEEGGEPRPDEGYVFVVPFLQGGRLPHRMQAPQFRLPAYAVYPEEVRSEAVGLALAAMRHIAAARK